MPLARSDSRKAATLPTSSIVTLRRRGALLVEMPSGQQFRLGAGFSDAQRVDPPPVGSWVTYRFRGTHDGGLPRFASFVRVREDIPPAR